MELVRITVLKVHPREENRERMPGVQRIGHRNLKCLLLEAYTKRLVLFALLGDVPDRAGVIKHLAAAVTVFDGSVHDVGTTGGVDIEAVPSAQGLGVAQNEAVKQRRVPLDASCQERHVHAVAVAAKLVAGPRGVARELGVGRKQTRGRFQRIRTIQLLLLNAGFRNPNAGGSAE